MMGYLMVFVGLVTYLLRYLDLLAVLEVRARPLFSRSFDQ